MNDTELLTFLVSPESGDVGEPPVPADLGIQRYSYFDFMRLPLQRPQHAVQDLFVEGQNALLIGRFGIGKTLLALQLSTALASGCDFLGRQVLRPYKVAFIDCENGQEEIQSRMKVQAGTLSLSQAQQQDLDANWEYVDGRSGSIVFAQSHSKELEEVLSKEPEVLIVDNLGRVFDGEIEKPADVAKFFGFVEALRRQHTCLQRGFRVFLHHPTKASRDPQQSVSLLTSPYEFLCTMRGSGRLLDFSETRLALAEETVYGSEAYYVLNGVMRSGNVSPLLLKRDGTSLSFGVHDDKEIVVQQIFGHAPRRRELFDLLPKKFLFKDAVALRDKSGRAFSKDTVNETLQTAKTNRLVHHNVQSGEYEKLA